MSAARKALDALDAATSKATPPMWYPVGRMTEEESLQIGGVDPHIASDSGTTVADYISERNAECACLSVNLAAPLAAVVRAAMAERAAIKEELEGSPFGGPIDPFNGARAKTRHALDAALDAFNDAAAAQGFQ